ncbi:MAG: ABC transporter permease subunit [Eubacteriales bacterium]
MKSVTQVARKKGRLYYFKKSLPLTLMALPGIIIMVLFKYLPMSGMVLAFKKFSVRGGIFGSPWNGMENFQFLFKSSDAFIITRNTLVYNVVFIIIDLVAAVAIAIALNELLNKKRAKFFQTVFMAPYFLSWVVISFIAFAFLSVDKGFLNTILKTFGMETVSWYSEAKYWPFILVFFQVWKTAGYSTVMYLGSLVSIPHDYYEAACIDGATKWQQIKFITIPCLRSMMIVLTILAIGKIFFADFGLFYQLPRNSGPLFSATNVIDTYVYRALKETGNIGMAAAANLYQSLVGFVFVITSNFVVRKIDRDSALF